MQDCNLQLTVYIRRLLGQRGMCQCERDPGINILKSDLYIQIAVVFTILGQKYVFVTLFVLYMKQDLVHLLL